MACPTFNFNKFLPCSGRSKLYTEPPSLSCSAHKASFSQSSATLRDTSVPLWHNRSASLTSLYYKLCTCLSYKTRFQECFFFNKYVPSLISVLTVPIPLPNHVTMRCPVQPIRVKETICSISAILLAFEKPQEILLQIRYIRIASLAGEVSVNKRFYWAKGQKTFSKAQHNGLGEKK